MRATSYQTALLLALLFKRAGASRARLSEITIRKLSGRSSLRSAFIGELRDQLDHLGFAFLETERGYAMVPLAALSGAPAITAKKHLPDIVSLLQKGKDIDYGEISEELGLDDDTDSDSQDES